jgi:sugar phosphate permease
MFWSGAAGSFQMLLLSRLALGMVLGTAGPVISSLVGDFFPPQDRARIWGYILSGDLIGSGFGFLVSGNVASVLSWRASFWLLGTVSLGVGWLIWRRLPEPERGAQSGGRQSGRGLADRIARRPDSEPRAELVLDEDPSRMPLARALRYVLRVRTNVVLIVATTVGYFFFAGLRTFGVVFARGHFGLGQSVAATLFTLVGLGALAGVLLGGRFADALIRRGYTRARIAVPAVAFLLAPVFLAPGLLATSLAVALPLFFVGAAAFSLPNPPLDAARLDVMPSRLWGRAEGIRTFVRTLATAGAPLLFGIVADALGGSGTQHAAGGLTYAFLIMLVPLALNGLILTRALRTYPRDVATAVESDRRIAARGPESAAGQRTDKSPRARPVYG